MSREALPPRRPVTCAQVLDLSGALVTASVYLGRTADTFTHRVCVRYATDADEWRVVVDTYKVGDVSPFATRSMGRNAGWGLVTASWAAGFEVDALTEGPPHFSAPWLGGGS